MKCGAAILRPPTQTTTDLPILCLEFEFLALLIGMESYGIEVVQDASVLLVDCSM